MRAALSGRGRDGPCGKGNGWQKGNKTITKRQINGIIKILFLIEKIVGIIGPRSRYYRTPHGTTTVSVVRTFTCRAYAVSFACLCSAPCFSTVFRRLPSIFSTVSDFLAVGPSHDPSSVHAVRYCIYILFTSTPLLAPYVICCSRLFLVAVSGHDGSPQCYDHRGPSLDPSVTDYINGSRKENNTSAFFSSVELFLY